MLEYINARSEYCFQIAADKKTMHATVKVETEATVPFVSFKTEEVCTEVAEPMIITQLLTARDS
jgi:hypothetical protein